jgi:ABC-type transport system involved in cytochrome bd biosynthesis fused ATPase/permease subunit
MAHWMLWEIAGLFEDFGVVKDGVDVIAREHAITDKPNAPALNVSQGRINFADIHFNYGKPASTTNIINGLTLAIKPGEKVGLVGRSGAGKSTIASLLLRFYDLESGSITIDKTPPCCTAPSVTTFAMAGPMQVTTKLSLPQKKPMPRSSSPILWTPTAARAWTPMWASVA